MNAQMDPKVVVEVNAAQLARLQARLSPEQLRRALFNAVKRTTQHLAKGTGTAISKTLNLQPRFAKRAVTFELPRNSLTPIGYVRVRRRPMPAAAFKGVRDLATGYKLATRVNAKGQAVAFPQRAGGGVSVKFTAGHNRLRWRHAFLAVVKATKRTGEISEHLGVFVRDTHLATKGPHAGKGKIMPHGRSGRFAIKEVFGPSAYSLLVREGKLTPMMQECWGDAQLFLGKQLASQLYRFTNEREIE